MKNNWKEEIRFNIEYDGHKDHLLKMVTDFADLWDGVLGMVRTAYHILEVYLPQDLPIRSPSYRYVPRAQEIHKEEMYKLLEMKLADPAQSELDSPIVFVTKKDGSVRCFIHYKRLNAKKGRESYPMKSNGRVHRLVRYRKNLLNLGRKQWLF